MLVRPPLARVAAPEDFVEVAPLPGCVVIGIADLTPATEVRVVIASDGEPIDLSREAAGRDPLDEEAGRVVVPVDMARVLGLADARLQVWVQGFLLHDQPLSPDGLPLAGRIEDVRKGHLVGWAAHLLGEPVPALRFHLDGVEVPRCKAILTDHELCRYAPSPTCTGFRLRLPRAALDGAEHTLQIQVGDRFLAAFQLPGTVPAEPAAPPEEALPAYLFDREYYVVSYADIADVLTRNPAFDAAEHFWECGLDEGRLPSLSFDIEFVQHRLRKYHDLALTRRETITRFFATPAKARFVPNRWFCVHTFRALYKHLFDPSLSDYEVFAFYLANVARALLSPSGLFDEAAYRERYPDVDEQVLTGQFLSGFHHFMVAGWRSGRVNLHRFGDGIFSTDARGREERDTLFHRFGELRPVVPWFIETFYLDAYPDVREHKRRGQVQSGLEHFLSRGLREGRVPHPALLGAVKAADGDVAAFHRAAATTLATATDLLLTLEDATALFAYVSADGIPRDRAALGETIWAYVRAPWLNGSFNAERYLAANPDLAEAFGHDHRRVVDHWRSYGIREGRPAPGSNLFANRMLTATDLLRGGTGVNFFAPISLPNGLGAAARGYVGALQALGIEVDTYDVSGLLHAGAFIQLFAPARLRHSINLIFLNPDQTLPLAARYGTQLFDHRVNVGFWVWELPIARPEWRSTLACYDMIVTPSDFCTEAFAGETDAPVVTLPYVVDRATLERHLAAYQQNRWIDRLLEAKQSGRKIVLFIMDASSYTVRKGADVFLRLVRLAEEARPGQFLFVIKTHSRDHFRSSDDADAVPASVVVIDEIFSWPDLCKLKQTADVLVSPHRSEGFGLNIFESIVLGVPVICSPFGGGPDALPADFPFFIGGKLKEVGSDLGPYRSAAIWFDPDARSALDRLLALFDDEAASRDYFAELRLVVAQRLSAQAVGTALSDLLARQCGLGLRLQPLADLFERSREECFDFNMGTALSDGAQSVSAMLASCFSPRFSVVTPTWNSDPEWLQDIYRDLCAQKLQSWEWCIHDDGSTRPATLAALKALRAADARVKLRLARTNGGISVATNGAVRISSGEYLVFVDHDDRISPDLLSAYAGAIDGAARPDVLYCDEDKLFPDGSRRDHYFKPDWSPEHLLSTMYALHCLCVRKSLFLRLDGYRAEFSGAQDHDFLLRATSDGARVHHVDRVLYHWRISRSSAALSAGIKPYADDAGRRAVADHLRRMDIDGVVEAGLVPGTYRVRPTVSPGTVALNILTSCTRAEGASNTYVANLVASILAHSYPVDIEIRLITDLPALATAKPIARLDRRVKIVPFDRGDEPFNFSIKSNFAIRTSEASRNVLLNDDMEAIDGEWLGALLELLELPGVGVVSGRLLYPDDTVQHSGIVLGVNGSASHVFVGAAPDYVGYNAFSHVIRNYSAVTGAMMAFRRSLFDRVGGFNPDFPIDFNDTDFCLRVLERGERVVFTPFARMRHFESRSAPRLTADSYDEYRFAQKWRRYIDHDPHYNRNLRRDSATYEAVGYA